MKGARGFVPALVLACAGAAGFLPGFLALAPNRLASGHAIWLLTCAPVWGAAIAGLLAGYAAARWFGWRRAAMAGAVALLLLVPLAAGAGATALAGHAPPAARVQLAAGFWLLLVCGVLACVDAAGGQGAGGKGLGPAARLALAACVLGAVAAMAAGGCFASLSLAQEYQGHRAEFATALARHVLLVGLTLAGCGAVGVPLGLAAWARPASRGGVFAVLNVVQTLPSIALFGLLMAPLAALGFSGIGLLPALVALVLYALLPVVRAIVSALDGVAAAPLEAALGLGFSPGRVMLAVRLPLAAPALLAGLRVVVVQTVGLAVVAALIGAGGLGDFVFQGLGQYALDLVLLGALPATMLALVADSLLTLAAEQAARRAA